MNYSKKHQNMKIIESLQLKIYINVILRERLKIILILIFNIQEQLMQKIVQNLKHKHRNVKFNEVLKNVQNTAKEQEVNLFTVLIGDSKSNIRQKLKVIKRVVQSKDQRQFHLKQIAARFLLDLHLKEYIFGNTQSKPSLLNILKRFNEIRAITPLLIIQAFKDISLQQFSQARNSYELLQAFSKKQQSESFKLFLIRFEPAKTILLTQFEQCYKIVFSQGFKLKWLQYLVDVLRCLNGFIRIYGKSIDKQLQKSILIKCRSLTTQFKVLTKQVLTQLFMIIVFLNPEQPAPKAQQGNCLIHYFHAKNVVLGVNILKDLLVILVTVKEMQYRCQMVPILLKAFQEHYSTFQDKANVFDQVVTLFDVGRSVYNYLEQIVTIIIRDPDSQWNLQGSYLKKFFIATIALKQNISIITLLVQWPTIISDIITHAGSMTTPYVNDCALILLQRLFQESNKQYQKWSQIWINDYKKALLSNDRGQVRGIIQFINPILLSVNSEPYLLKQMLALSQKEHSIALQMGVIALLKCYKDLGKIQIDNTKKLFIHSQDSNLYFSSKQISELILSADSTIALKTLQFVTVHPKGSQPMEPLQLELALYFYKHCLKTSLPEYRKSYITATKKMFQRLRTTYDAELTKTALQLAKNKRYKPKQYFSQFKIFLSNLIDLCFESVFPDVIFQIANPALQILLLIGQFFSRKTVQIKKGQNYEASFILNQTNYFLTRNFDNLLCCLQSSYQSVRLLSHQILQLFYDLSDESKLKQLWSESLENANKLTIKSYEYACRILALISQVFPKVISLPSRFALQQLNICEYFLKIIQDRYQVFRVQFATQEENYYKNLIHGMLTVFSYTLDHLATKLRANPQYFVPHFPEIKIFLKQFFDQINNIVLFSVQVCSSNISTVVLDSLPQSQTDKKYKVDCRGHFLEETGKGVSGLIESTALLTSMENEEQGIQNTLVVSFYLLTREAGLVFQSIGNIAATSHSHQYLPADALVQLVNSYFYALINLKHMGSVDRIAGGLGKMARLIFDNEDPRLSELPQRMLDKLIENLKLGNFTNILRRSAGVPYAFTCLLKSEALKRRQMIQKTLTTLLELSRNDQVQAIQLRIHSLNILKKLFQDGDLKSDLQRFVSTAFMSSIRGFTSEEWGVRNSSLMLFTILANRTVGIKPTYNLLQFFHRCPQLLDFFSEQLRNMELNTMYPPLYPIVLLLSRLLPFDLSQRVKLPNKGDLNLKQIRKDKLLEMLPLIEKAGLNNNHMGRVMAAKSILPFMDIDGIVPYCLKLLKDVKQIQNNNLIHYLLTTAYHLLVSLQQLENQQKYQPKLGEQTVYRIALTIYELTTLIKRHQSAVITESLIKLIHHMLGHFQKYISSHYKYDRIISQLLELCNSMVSYYLFGQKVILQFNLGHSMAVKECLYLHADLLHKYHKATNFDLVVQTYSKFLVYLTGEIGKGTSYLHDIDNQIIQCYLKNIVTFLKDHPSESVFNKVITRLVNELNLQTVKSDAILIKMLEFRSILKLRLTPNQEEYLKIRIKQTRNHFLQIVAFKYFQAIDVDHPSLLPLLNQFSRPEQLQELRQCCVEYLEIYPKERPEHHIAYIRLLEDEEYQIRLEMARIVSKKLGVNELNEEMLKYMILQKMGVQQFEAMLTEASDYEIKRKNAQQQRIFSYDKPNKYRSDINNIIHSLLYNSKLTTNGAEVAAIMGRVFGRSGLEVKEEVKCINQYIKDIIWRNEYQFQTILRIYFMIKNDTQIQWAPIFKSHPLLEKIYLIYR